MRTLPRMKEMRTAVCLALVGALVACRRPPAGPPAVALVGADRILASDLKSELDHIRAESEEEVKLDPEKAASLRHAVLSDLIDRHLLLAEAARLNISVTDREVDEVIAQRKADRLKDATAEPDPLTADVVRARTKDQLTIERLLLREVAARVALGPDDTKNYYDQHPEEFKLGEEIRVSQIVVLKRDPVDLEAKKQADALRVMLNRTDFAKLAREQSAGPEAVKGGDLGWFGHGMMPPEFDVCFQLHKGQISSVIETQYGFHIFKLMDRRDGQVLPFNDVEHRIALKLQRAAVEKAQVAYVERLRQKAGVKIIDAEVERVL